MLITYCYLDTCEENIYESNRAEHATQQGTAPESELFLDETFPYYLVSYACTHSGRHRSRCSGKRPRQTVRTIGCKARRDGESYFLKVSVHETEHNHRLGRDSYKRLPSNRLQLPVAELATVNMLRKVGLSRKKILKYIWDNTDSEPDIVDIHNLIAKLKRDDKAGTTVSDRLAETLDRFCEKDSFAAAHVCMDRQGGKPVARCITLQSSHMRSLFSSFPEVLLVDATHDTNSERYKLFSFMVHDSHGRGQHVQHALMTDERAESMRLAILQFKRCNPACPAVTCIVVDKDFTEIGVFRSEFPDARVLLYQFHAIRYIQDRIGKHRTDWIQFSPIAILIVRATSEEEYKRCFDYMKQELETKDGEVPKIKTIVDRDVDLDEAVTSLIWWARYKEKQFTADLCRVGRVVDTVRHTNPELARLAQIVSKHAYDIIEEQFKVVVSPQTYYTIERRLNKKFALHSENTTCVIDGATWKSFCMLGRT
ncbi:Hypothetical protein PHPALM_8812 [Phytophthora palmivora]|uniref:ZSWIM1/3 RNaseH-like domain-containing protein n=1 Tax=Phytophthora palmivora TaxID=4796 RepID=A0A2P4Y9B1_9STRA|nr:Hypothetical protein PHPALM_8812 [Phytophthora palmivora]